MPRDGDVAAALRAVPEAPGVAQLVGEGGRHLLVGMAANLRRWAGSNLGLHKPAKMGARPKTDLRSVAAALRFTTTESGFEQRLVYERLIARHVPLEQRRDLKRPAYLRLDAQERFPRASVAERADPPLALYGPFRDRRAAQAARDALHKAFPLRPCDFAFEPDPGWPTGLGCVYAQVKSCAAPCLARVGEADYRAIAAEAASQLAAPSRRTASADWLPPWTAACDARALVLERVAGAIQLFPIHAGRVLDREVARVPEEALDAALAKLRFQDAPASDDTPWLVAWLRERRRRGVYLVLEGELSRSGSALRNAARSALAAAARGSPAAS